MNTWYHLVGVREVTGAAKTLKLFVNGLLVSSTPDPTTGRLDNFGPDYIGRRFTCGTNNPFNGLIDEVSIYNRALPDSEVQDIFNAGSAGKCKPQIISVDSKATFLHADCGDSPTPPTILDLAALGFAPGDELRLSYTVSPPGFSFFGCSGPFVGATETPVIGVFSNSDTLLPPGAHPRVPGAIEAGTDIVTGPTLFCNEAGDIPQDFRLSLPSGLTIQIPAGATRLFLGVADSLYRDNCGTILINLERIGAPPTINCPTDITVSTDPVACSAVVNFNATATGSPAPAVTCNPPSGAAFTLGSTTVNCSASNGVAPDATCSFTVRVTNNPPTASANGPYSVNEGASVTVNASGGDPEGGSLRGCATRW